jgi:hypothetical protein
LSFTGVVAVFFAGTIYKNRLLRDPFWPKNVERREFWKMIVPPAVLLG